MTNPLDAVRGIRLTKAGKWEAAIDSVLLPKGRVTRNFDDRDSAATYKLRMLGFLQSGLVPAELTALGSVHGQFVIPAERPQHSSVPAAVARAGSQSPLISSVITQYLAADSAQIAKSDRPLVVALQNQLTGNLAGVNTFWTDNWVRHMKRVDVLAPGTIRKKVDALARAIDWWNRRQYPTGDAPANALRLLPRGYSAYQSSDTPTGEVPRQDVKRDRRLAPEEYTEIEAVLNGKYGEGKERAWGKKDSPDFLMLFRLIVHTGLRLREAYRVRKSDIRFDLRTIHVHTSKTGSSRDVPMTPEVMDWLKAYLPNCPNQIVFPFWGGGNDEESLKAASAKLTARFRTLFAYSGCLEITEHDLRHEATCRWMDRRDEEGRWMYRPEEVRRITGHKSAAMFDRYLSLRGTDLADRMY